MKIRLFILYITLLVLGGCVKDTALDAGQGRKVIVEFVLTEDSVQHLYLSLTGVPGEETAPPVQEAEIKLIDVTRSKELGSNVEFSRFVRGSDIQWTLEYAGIPGHEYRLEVKVDGYDVVWAEQKMPDRFEMVVTAIGHVDISKYRYAGYGAFYYVDNIPDFLIVQGMKRDKETGEYTQVEELCTDYPGVEEMNSNGRFYDGNPIWDGTWKYMFPNLIGKELHNGFLFLNRVNEEHSGLDRLYAFSREFDYSTGKEDLSARGFCVSGSFYTHRAYYDSNYNLIDYDEYLIFSSLSPDYGRFVKDAYQLKKVHGSGVLSSIYLRDNIHSNIQGGLGIFGAKVSDIQAFNGNYQSEESDLPNYEF